MYFQYQKFVDYDNSFYVLYYIGKNFQDIQVNRDYLVRKMSDEIYEIIRVLQLTTYDEEEWDVDDIIVMKKVQVCNVTGDFALFRMIRMFMYMYLKQYF